MQTVKINVGKNGITESLISEINLQLEKRGAVKIKMLKNFGKRKEKDLVVKELAERLGCRIRDVRGFVITLER
ncbi:MAG: YhbY family RNA-binding protein [Archaeoglobales archaeon]|jgi:RNA-binding protein|nr:YhbY family RNA-binding protein [Archaeoglobi archaeon]NHW23280.1 YhbY family RNA-binding protein [Archaeoglobales archaeon]TDA28143.1 MAG: RNA-binding protein [Archaeoglobi archaeon]